MSRWYDNRIENILRTYPKLAAQATIDKERLHDLFPGCTPNYSSEPHGSGTSDSTGNYAIKRTDDTYSMRQARAIEVSITALTQDGKDLVRLRYFERWRKYDVCSKMHISERQFDRVRREVLDDIAELLLNVPQMLPKCGNNGGS
jgi:predicted DNA-binding protein (UPF0251 family)